MDIKLYIEKVNLSQQNELTKVKLIAFYDNMRNNKPTFMLTDVVSTLAAIGHSISNISRLKGYLVKSKDFRRISDGEYTITPLAKEKLKEEYGELLVNEDIIISDNEVLDETLFCGKKNYLDKLIMQINHCYKNYCYDACAVCMRRVFEICLILAYENYCIQDEIKNNNGDYAMLEKIVANAVNNSTLNISRSKKDYDLIREIGNYAAHKILYNTRKKDIDDVKQTYRVCLEELYYKAGLKK